MNSVSKKLSTFGSFLLFLICLAFLPPSVAAQPSDPASRYRLAVALEQANDLEHALSLYQELASSDPSNPVYGDAVQRLLVQLKRYDDAVAFMNARLKSSPGNPSLLVALGTVYYRAGKEQDAYAAWQRVIDANPKNPNSYRMVASAELENRLLDRAVATYQKGRDVADDPQMFTLEIAQLQVATMNFSGATNEYLRWLEHNPTQVGYVENRLSTFTSKPDGRNEAIRIVRDAVTQSETPGLDELLGWLYIEGKEWEKAYDVYASLDRLSGSNGSALSTFADHALAEREYTIAVKAYREALSMTLPAQRRPAVMYGYASALKELVLPADSLVRGEGQTSGRIPETISSGAAVKAFEDLIAQYPGSQLAVRSRYAIGMIRMDRDADLTAATTAFEQARDDPAGPPALKFDAALRLGEVATWRGDTATARRMDLWVAARPEALPDQSDEASFRLAELDYFGGHFASALAMLNTLSLNLKADYANDALTLKAFLQENMTTADALQAYANADFVARQHRNAEAIAMFQDVIQRYPKSLLVDDAMMKIAALQTATRLYQDALATYRTLLDKFKGSSIDLDRAQFLIGDVYQHGLHDANDAIAAYEQLLATYPKSIMADEARRRVRELRGEAQ